MPKNIAKNFAKYFHEKGRLLVDVELERMKDQVPLRVSQRFTFCYHLRLSTCLISLKAEIFARGFLGEVEAGNLRRSAPGGGKDGAPGHDEGKVPEQGEGKATGGQEDCASKTGEV